MNSNLISADNMNADANGLPPFGLPLPPEFGGLGHVSSANMPSEMDHQMGASTSTAAGMPPGMPGWCLWRIW